MYIPRPESRYISIQIVNGGGKRQQRKRSVRVVNLVYRIRRCTRFTANIPGLFFHARYVHSWNSAGVPKRSAMENRAKSVPKTYRSVLASSRFSSNQAFTTSQGYHATRCLRVSYIQVLYSAGRTFLSHRSDYYGSFLWPMVHSWGGRGGNRHILSDGAKGA